MICASSRRTPGCIAGHALAVAKLTDIVSFTEAHLAAACMDEMPDKPSYAWILDDIRAIEPFPVKGRLNLFEVEAAIRLLPDDITQDERTALYNPLLGR